VEKLAMMTDAREKDGQREETQSKEVCIHMLGQNEVEMIEINLKEVQVLQA
jgi:hypothetical protein